MADVLAIPAEFDTILVADCHLGLGTTFHGEKRPLPRPPLGPFTHHAVGAFAKTCSEGRIGLNWRDHLVRARKTWHRLSAEEHSILRQAAEADKQRYYERVADPGATDRAKELSLLVDRRHQKAEGNAPSAFELFKHSPETRPRLFDAKEGPLDPYEFYGDKVLVWFFWGRIDEEERTRWREEARRRLDMANNARRMRGEEPLVLNAEPPDPQEAPSAAKMARLADSPRSKKSPGEVDDATEDEDEHEAPASAEVGPNPNDHLRWKPVEDQDLTTDEKNVLEAISPNLRRWDRMPREARNAYTLYFADRITARDSPRRGENPHSPTTRANMHANWQAADVEDRQHFMALAKTDKEQFDRQSKERRDWQGAWRSFAPERLLPKVIDRWRPNASFDAGQNRVRAEIPRLPGPGPSSGGDYALPSLYYPVIRTDYSNDAVYKHIRHVLMHSEFQGDPVFIDMSFYDGLEPPPVCREDEERGMSPWMSCAMEDVRANDYEWCKTHLENKSVDELKGSLGELSFFGKEHRPIYTFGGHLYGIVVDSRSMKDGTVVFLSCSSYDLLDTRPGGDRGPAGAWEEDRSKQWYLAPRLQAADVAIELINLDIGNVSWDECRTEYRSGQELDLISDQGARRWRGWQWAIEYIFGEQALENVVGVIQQLTVESYLLKDEEEEEEDANEEEDEEDANEEEDEDEANDEEEDEDEDEANGEEEVEDEANE